MKTHFTRFALTLVCCLTLVSACKKEDSDPSPAASSTPPEQGSYLMLNQNKYLVLVSEVERNSSDNHYQCMLLAAFSGDTILSFISFQTLNPTLGMHSIDTGSVPDAGILIIEKANYRMSLSISGNCEVLTEKGKYRFVLTDLHFIDVDSGKTLFKGSGNVVPD